MTKSRWLRKLLPLAVSFSTTIALAGAIAPPASAQTNPPPPQPQQVQVPQEEGIGIPMWIYPVGGLVVFFMFVPKIGWILGLIAIGEREVGIVTKKFSSKN